jgi:predicted TIM-barrel fold metal-dependent hydrolase
MKKLSEILGYAPIDIHSHFNHGVLGDVLRGEDAVAQRSDLDFLFSEYENIGIECGAFSTYASVLRGDRIPEENDYLWELAHKDERIYQWVVLHPEVEKTFEQAKRMLGDRKVLGIKLHSRCQGYDIEAHGDKLFSFANEMGATVVIHPDKTEILPDFCNKYPNMRLILAHLEGPLHVNAIKKAKYGNLYTDTSGGASSRNNALEYAVREIGADKILFGTDTYSAAFQAGRVALARISDEEKKMILRDNALRLFPHAFK